MWGAAVFHMDIKKAWFAYLGIAALMIPAAGYLFSLPFRIRYKNLEFNDLPHNLHGLKILHISDLHGRSPSRMQYNIWDYFLNLDFDMAVLTGDIILDYPAQLKPHINGLRKTVEKAPVFYVEGNHETHCYNEISGMLNDIGVNILDNNSGIFTVGNKNKFKDYNVHIAGFKDFYSLKNNGFKDSLHLINKLKKSCDFHIILSHQPQIFDMISFENIKGLVLAGHTHGGQVRLPMFPALYAPGQGILPKYGDGCYKNKAESKLKMYISRGVGATIFPLRTFNPPEVTIIELLKV